jgi:integrase
MKIEGVIDRTGGKGKRDYAMILLASRLGLRASDITRLQFASLNWDINVIILKQHKTKREIILPLLSDIGDAIIDYIKNGRPDNDSKNLFLSLIQPYRPIRVSTLCTIVTNYIYAAGVSPKGRHHGTHSLRHSLATNLLENGTALPVISEVLGHGSTGSTMYYLGVNIKSLLECSQNVPDVPEDFYSQKGGMLYA